MVAGLGSHAHALFSSAPIRGIRLDTYIFAAPVEYLRTSVASGRRTDPTCTDPTLEIVRLRQCALAASCFTNVSTYILVILGTYVSYDTYVREYTRVAAGGLPGFGDRSEC